MRLAEQIANFLGRVEVVLAGADDALREGNDAVAAGDAMRARKAARQILARVPGSPLGLALLADACELGGLDAELALTLEELAERVPSRADVWTRLGAARSATGSPVDEVRDAYVRALAVAPAGSDARREALLTLADIDLAAGDGARAELWLDRAASDGSPDVALRRAEARLAQGDAAGALTPLETFESDPTDGRGALARGRAYARLGDARAFAALLRAAVLETRGASEELSSALAWIPSDAAMRARVRAVVDARGEAGLARFRAAFARAEGHRREALDALREAVASGDASAAEPLLEAALEDRDYASLRAALDALAAAHIDSPLIADAQRIPHLDAGLAHADAGADLFNGLDAVTEARVVPWADASARALAALWVPPNGAEASWSALLARLDSVARELSLLDAIADVAELSAERLRPVRVAIVGEFNAGKSTFINALIGADVAPTGVLPTTATLHHLRYAPDPFARILFARREGDGDGKGVAPADRIVATTSLRAVLKSDLDAPVRRVEILLPIAALTRVELLDTPGFNAPDASHAEAARTAFEEADFILWLFDAAQAMKQTERVILEEARAAKLPVQILVNKADRLKGDDLAKVMGLVETSLTELGMASWSPPIALSARLALQGKLGDAAALAASRWDDVQRLFDEQIVARSVELKERALRRRAALVVAKLASRAARIAEEERARSDADAARVQSLAHAAAQLDARIDDAEQEVARALAASVDAFRRELALVVVGRSDAGGAAATDRTLARYRDGRALALVAPELARALASLANVAHAGVSPASLAPLARSLVRASSAYTSGDAPLAPLARAAVASLVEHLTALAVAQRGQRGSFRSSGLLRELGALQTALNTSDGTGATATTDAPAALA